MAKSRESRSAAAEIRDLQAEYDDLAKEAGGFDKATLQLERQWQDEVKVKRQSRAVDRQDLVKRKGDVFRRLHAAQERQKQEPADKPVEAAPEAPAVPAATE